MTFPIDAFQEHCDYTYATDAEEDQFHAHKMGEQSPDQCWISSERDVWYKNPFYNGVETPHPESDATAPEWREWEIKQAAWAAEQNATASRVKAYVLDAELDAIY